ncbi:hypothetical protein VNO77_05415 [Canavalia gladiata]|uniref:Protein BIG GRAIN 1-like B n=1 Tax=Canavalia gladiata TaxID=3824 RepID=A0AAN9N407_CANGL
MHQEKMHSRERESPQRRRTPSFSSTLLDAIYRSTDQSKTNLNQDHKMGLSLYNHQSKHPCFTHNSVSGGRQRMNLRRAVMLEDWMEKQSSHTCQFLNSSSSSSECSSGGLFSSSETDTTYKKQRPRPKSENRMNSEKQKPQREGGFARTKLRALKIYGELNQKVKQPISPASRIATFLSSIFNSDNVKKAKMCYVGAVEDVSFDHKSKSPCFSSSVSSFSTRSCISKTPSSAKGKPNNGVKRSVRFYPVSVILGEDSQQGHKCVYESEPNLLPLSGVRKIARNSSIKELNNTKENGAEGFTKGYQNNGKGEFDFRGFYDDHGDDEDEEEEDEEEEDDDDDDDDDAVSCSSSDLFELDHLIGAARYQEELPVYETTNFVRNKAIANGLCL